MSDDKKPMYIKNPHRGEPEAGTPYVPNYKIKGLNPETRDNDALNVLISLKGKSKPLEPVNISVPVATEIKKDSPFGVGKTPLMNVGNNVEHTWAGVDGIIDDLSETIPNQKMIDNNDEIQITGFNSENLLNNTESPSNYENNSIKNYDSSMEEDDDHYLLMVKGEFVSNGNIKDIEEEVRALIFNTHPLCEKYNIEAPDIDVFKKMKIKVGVFIG